ncbi:alpha/beta-hydrolase [Trametopsis cervina]|nr:alpha/beta-hydrolase [Trametopsis cervina]
MHYIPSVAFLLTAGSLLVQAVSVKDPRNVVLSSATCKVPNRAAGVTQDIQIKYVDINPGAKRTLLMVHGWPGLWHVWKGQIEAFKDDYHIIAVNQRGFGGSEHPGDLETSSTFGDLVGDLTCVLEHAQVSHAACLGHDWGTQTCYEAARMRPDVFEAVIGTAIPYIPYSGPFVPIANMVAMLPTIAYNVFFQDKTLEAAQELNGDIRRTLRGIMRTVESPPPSEFLKQTDSFMRGWDSVEDIPPIPFLTTEEEEYWVEQFESHKFDHTLGFYTHGTRHGSWTFAQAQENHTIPQPVLAILPTNDPVCNWVEAAVLMKSADHVPRLTMKTVDAAHWIIIEKPTEVNAIMKEWLDEHYAALPTREEQTHAKDEL